MKKIIFVFIAALVGSAIASSASNHDSLSPTKALTKEESQRRFLEKTGGIIECPGNGKIAIVNCQNRIPVSTIEEKISQMNKYINVNVELLKGEWKLGSSLPPGASAALYIVDDPTLPISLIAPESQWGVLNVAQFEDGLRFRKAFMRTMTLTFGAGVAQFKGSPMQTVTKVEDLDRLLSDGFTFDTVTSIVRNLHNLGVTQSRKISYRKACMEGWANAPTNSYQQAIWDDIHKLPTEPMKIKPETQKVTE